MSLKLVICLTVLLLLFFITLVTGSAGDHSFAFVKCFERCMQKNCTLYSDEEYLLRRVWYMRVLRWTCRDECRYVCMWKTVDAYQKDDTPVPQFFGKWPFIRVFGIQEPASVVFSILNGLANIVAFIRFFLNVPSKAPMYFIWQTGFLVAVNAWVWAAIFHSRDTDFTEKMDYFCAIGVVLYSVIISLVRMLRQKWPLACYASIGAALSFFVYHIHYLAMVRFDYGYNMTATVTVGVINSALWLFWSLSNMRRLPHVWKATLTIICLNTFILLELKDFPPIWWTFDAHSLWHACTAPLPLIWGSFAIDDSLYMLEESTKAGKPIKLSGENGGQEQSPSESSERNKKKQ